MHKPHRYLVSVGLVVGAAVLSPMAAAERMTPEDAVALALTRHPRIRAADDEVLSADADRRTARSGYLPRLDLTSDWVRSDNPVFVFASKLGQEQFGMQDFALDALNTPSPFTNAATRLVLKQNVWDAGRTLHYKEATQLGVEATEGSRARTREEVAFGALRAFWDAVLADEMLRVTRAAEEAARANVALAREHEAAGLAVASDRMSAEVRLAEVQAMRIRAEHGTRVARAALRQALGLREDREFDLAPPELTAATGGEDVESRVDEALASRQDYQSLSVRLRQAAVGEKIAKSHWIPEIGVGAQMEWNGASPFEVAGRNWTVGLAVRIPVFDGLETSSRVARARSDRDQVEAYRESMEEGIRLEVRAAAAEAAAAAERLKVADSVLSQAGEALRIVRERYAEGMAVMVELLGAEAALTSAKGNRASATRDLALARAGLDLATGRSLAATGGQR
jgi:outer membrane protein TolC